MLLLVLSLGACADAQAPQFSYEITLEDITDSHDDVLTNASIIEKLTLPSSEEVSPHKFKVKFSQIDDKHLQVFYVDSLDYSDTHFNRVEKDRIEAQKAFIARLNAGWSTLPV